jgi:hypothetical protein
MGHFDQFETGSALMTNNPNELTIENSVLVLIDHQPWVAFGVQSIDRKSQPALCRHRASRLLPFRPGLGDLRAQRLTSEAAGYRDARL